MKRRISTIGVVLASSGLLLTTGLGPASARTLTAGDGPAGPQAASAATYYVDPTGSDAADGLSPGTAWKSLSKVSAQTLNPGDHVLFKAGGQWSGQLATRGSGTEAAPIVVGSYGSGVKPRLDGGGVVDATVKVANQHDITVSGLEVTNTGSGVTPRIGIQVTAGDYGPVDRVSVTGNYVHDIQGATSGNDSSNPSVGGIIVSALGSATPTYYRNLTISGNEVANSRSYGIVTWSSWMQREGWNDLWDFMPVPAGGYRAWTPSTGVVVSGNTVHDISAGGITVMQAQGARIDHNRVDKTAQNHGNVGIWWAGADDTVVEYNEVSGTKYWGLASDGNGFDADASVHRSVVQYNYSHDNEGGFFIAVSTGTGPAEATIRYNVSQGDGNQIFALSTNAKNIDIYNNTIWTPLTSFIANNPDHAQFSMVKVWNTSVSNVSFRNNIIYNGANLAYRDSDAVSYDRNFYQSGPIPTRERAPLSGTAGLSAPGAAASINQLSGYTPTSGSPVVGQGLDIPLDGGRDVRGTPLPSGMVDLGAVQSVAGQGLNEAAPTVTTSFGNGQSTTPAAIADGSDLTPWASPSSGVQFPGTITLEFPSLRTVNAVELATIFGTGQGIKTFDVQSWDGAAWVTQLSNAQLSWTGSSAQVERKSVQLPAAVTTGKIRLLVKAANLSWGNLAVSEISTR
ncbi:right-handed parallel beta-helix repeat-containing protein [Arthrobacter sp. NPDC090010]|uniref:right-handed parallel beta-helix repeat-containing protein n=1 Tax=Arthrobacter sp. NPDC090010 TaxID=3363942 RepID=UPI0038223CF3